MARTLPADQRVSLERLIDAAGLVLHPDGEDLRGPCPRHPDDGVEVVVHPASNTWECPACEKKGGPVEWVMFSRKVSKTRAIDILSADAEEEPSGGIMWPDDDDELLDAVVGHYHETLLHERDALEYLDRRGLGGDELIRKLRLGYANRTLGYRLPSRNSGAGKTLRKRLESVGILRSTGHEHLSGSITVPVLDAAGKAIEVYGRKTTPSLRQGTALHLFLHDEPPQLWLLDPVAVGEVVVVTASVMDALSWWCVGYKLVLIAPTKTASVAQLERVLQGRTVTNAVIAFPRTQDPSEMAERLGHVGLSVARAVFPAGLDANDILMRHGDLGAIVRNAGWLSGSGPRVHVPDVIEAPQEDTQGNDNSEVRVSYGDRAWRVRGLAVNKNPETMRVNVMVTREEAGLHVDSFDLYSHRHRHGFIKAAAVEIGVDERVIKADLGKLLLQLEALQDRLLNEREDAKNEPVRLTKAEEAEALELLRDPNLTSRIAADMTIAGLVGEDTNKVMTYLAAVSRKLDTPLAILIQSSSSASKSTLMDAVLALVPEEDKVTYSSMTPQSLYYLAQGELKNKVLAVAEDAGADRAAYPLKILQSEGSLTIASTDKDAGTGRLVTREYHVQGPVALMLTTTATQVGEELSNRCIVLTVDEGRDQTRQIHEQQRRSQTLDGMLARRERDRIIQLHKNAQRLLRPLMVVNPHAPALKFADHQTRTRRDHAKYLTLIRAVTLLHQFQREVKTVEIHGEKLEYIEVTADDIVIANRLAHEALGRSLDELPAQTRNVLGLLHDVVAQDCERLGVERADYRFTRRHLRERLGLGNTQLRVHLARLVDMEYVVARRGSSGITYELCWSGAGQDGRPFLNGVGDTTTAGVRGEQADLTGGRRPGNGPETAGERSPESTEHVWKEASSCDSSADTKKPHVHGKSKSVSYRRGKR